MEILKEIEVPLSGLDAAESKLQALTQRAAKLGLPSVVWEVVGAEGEVAKLTVSTRPVQMSGGWTVNAMLDWTLDEGSLSYTMPGMIPHTPTPLACVCEHCGTKRDRNRTFLLKRDDGDVKQVGTSCVSDFVGVNPAIAAKAAAQAELWRDFEDDPWDEPTPCVGRDERRPVTMRDYLAVVALLIEHEGFVSQATTENQLLEGSSHVDSPTHEWASLLAWRETNLLPGTASDDCRKRWRELRRSDPLPHEERHLRQADEWVEQAQDLPDDSEFLRNVKTLAKDPVARPAHMPIAAAIPAAIQRHLGNEYTQEFAGVDGRRDAFRATLERKVPFTPWKPGGNPRVLCVFRDEAGRKLTWLTERRPSVPSEIGASYQLKATVKRHATTERGKETQLSRVAASLVETQVELTPPSMTR